MPNTPASSHVYSHPSLTHSSGGSASGHGTPPSAGPATLESAELLKGGKTVGISHNGNLYRLQATKLGKLILTK
ncbi:MAG: hemin uptake protein HemP [Comamonadaceae bacterium]|nr:MAG: hemin uptake protein HemP [Comamonadaceae bacterium]